MINKIIEKYQIINDYEKDISKRHYQGIKLESLKVKLVK